MNHQSFCYWLQGFLEMSGAKSLDEKQVEMLRRHLALTFANVTSQPDVSKGLGQFLPGGPVTLC